MKCRYSAEGPGFCCARVSSTRIAMRTVPAAMLEPPVVVELRTLGPDPTCLGELAEEAQARFTDEVQPLLVR